MGYLSRQQGTPTKGSTVEDTQCDAQVSSATYYEQAEYCENDKVEGSDYCAEHGEPNEPYDTIAEWEGVA